MARLIDKEQAYKTLSKYYHHTIPILLRLLQVLSELRYETLQGRRRGMKHKFNLYHDWIYPVLAKIVGKRYGCCDKLKNCGKCCKENGWDDWKKQEKQNGS